MKFTVRRASDTWSSKDKEVEIKTIKQLMEFIKESGTQIVMAENCSIVIYDDYLE